MTTKLYDPSLSTADTDLQEIIDGIKQAKSARLCLYCVPGTGKSAWAQHLGKCLDRLVLVKRCSDLLNCFVGGTEQLIARAFAEARRNEVTAHCSSLPMICWIYYRKPDKKKSWKRS